MFTCIMFECILRSDVFSLFLFFAEHLDLKDFFTSTLNYIFLSTVLQLFSFSQTKKKKREIELYADPSFGI